MTNINTITYDTDFLKYKFQFFDEDKTKVTQNPFTYFRQVFKDTAFKASQYKILFKPIYTKILLKTCSLVETDTCEKTCKRIQTPIMGLLILRKHLERSGKTNYRKI
jgi:hypothetical protein